MNIHQMVLDIVSALLAYGFLAWAMLIVLFAFAYFSVQTVLMSLRIARSPWLD